AVPVNAGCFLQFIHDGNFSPLVLSQDDDGTCKTRARLRLVFCSGRRHVAQGQLEKSRIAVPFADSELQLFLWLPIRRSIDTGTASDGYPHDHTAHSVVSGLGVVYMIMMIDGSSHVSRIERHRQPHVRNPVAMIKP